MTFREYDDDTSGTVHVRNYIPDESQPCCDLRGQQVNINISWGPVEDFEPLDAKRFPNSIEIDGRAGAYFVYREGDPALDDYEGQLSAVASVRWNVGPSGYLVTFGTPAESPESKLDLFWALVNSISIPA